AQLLDLVDAQVLLVRGAHNRAHVRVGVASDEATRAAAAAARRLEAVQRLREGPRQRVLADAGRAAEEVRMRYVVLRETAREERHGPVVPGDAPGGRRGRRLRSR